MLDRYEEPGCSICGASEYQVLYRGSQSTGSSLGDVTVSVAQCGACGFIYNSPRIRVDLLAQYYYTSSVASGQVYRDESAQGYYPRLNAERARSLSAFLSARQAGRLLDIGCGSGGFLDALRGCGLDKWELCGLDPSATACEKARAKGYRVEQACLGDEDFPPRTFDGISLVSVLEHLPDPRAALARVRKLLKPDGIVFIEVPNVLQPDLSVSGYFSLEHIQHFTQASLARLMRDCGWEETLSSQVQKGHAIRLVGTRRLSDWGDWHMSEFPDDADEAGRAVRHYAIQEARFLKHINQQLRTTLDAWKRTGRTSAVYGAGIHTASMMSHIDLWYYCDYLLDGDPRKQGTEFLGKKIFAPEEMLALGIDCILVSSQRFQEEIVRRIHEIAGPDIEIVTCYNPSAQASGEQA